MNNSPNLDNYLIDHIERNQYFQRSINIYADSNDKGPISNFYCTASYEQILMNMIGHIKGGQTAFTWTGPFGSGKSSLALFLQGLVSDDKEIVEIASSKLSKKNKTAIVEHFNSEDQQWKTLNLTGQTIAPEQIFKDALNLESSASAKDILEALDSSIDDEQRLIIFIDELGKVFDGAAKSHRPDDIYFLQQLAEFVNRTSGRVILIGMLHQSFTAYARQATAKTHNEWMKIQGRFVDFAITLSVEEQIYLIGQVINITNEQLEKHKNSAEFTAQIQSLVANIANYRYTNSESLTELLSDVFPIHPLVAILLCKLSQKNFGQNQRSIFSFLMSSEPNGFGYYLKNTKLEEFALFKPHQFWDYLDSNLNNAIIASEYSKQWLLSQTAVNRYEGLDDEAAVKLIKIIALISIFADGTGVHASPELLQTLFDINKEQLNDLIKSLESASIIFYSKFKQSYVLSEGSDFNLNDAVREQIQDLDSLPFEQLEQFEPIVAKKHYQLTGSLRWMEVKLLPVTDGLEEVLASLQDGINASLVGYFCLLIPKNDEEALLATEICKKIDSSNQFNNLVVALLDSHTIIIDMLKDKIALSNILKNEERLLNDKIARQETEGRLVEIEDALNTLLDKSLNASKWYSKHLENPETQLNRFKLSALASTIADKQVTQNFICNNELVNRNKPSPSAKGAIRELLKRMIERSEEASLGIDKFPPEKGVYESVIVKNGLHKADSEGNYYFSRPNDIQLQAIWKCADSIIAEAKGNLVTAKEIYEAWQAPPYGVKAGLHEILYIAYILSRHSDLANYINDEYKPSVQYLLAEYLIKVPADVGVREVSFLEGIQSWIHVLRDRLQEEFGARLNIQIEDEPLPIAQALVSIFYGLHPWIQRTNTLSPKTKQLRDILKKANDPNQLLFDDLPKFFNATDDDDAKVEKIIEGLKELDKVYPDLVSEINMGLQNYLKVKEDSVNPYTEINKRSEALFGKSGDYLLDAFIARLVKYDGSMNDAESLISLLAGNKPSKKWIDQDIIKAQQRIATYGFQFLEAEVNADVNASPDRQKVGVITKSPNSTTSRVREAHITSRNIEPISKKVEEIANSLKASQLDMNDRVAVIAKLLEALNEEDAEKEES